jgi:hypothetical protein
MQAGASFGYIRWVDLPDWGASQRIAVGGSREAWGTLGEVHLTASAFTASSQRADDLSILSRPPP